MSFSKSNHWNCYTYYATQIFFFFKNIVNLKINKGKCNTIALFLVNSEWGKSE